MENLPRVRREAVFLPRSPEEPPAGGAGAHARASGHPGGGPLGDTAAKVRDSHGPPAAAPATDLQCPEGGEPKLECSLPAPQTTGSGAVRQALPPAGPWIDLARTSRYDVVEVRRRLGLSANHLKSLGPAPLGWPTQVVLDFIRVLDATSLVWQGHSRSDIELALYDPRSTRVLDLERRFCGRYRLPRGAGDQNPPPGASGRPARARRPCVGWRCRRARCAGPLGTGFAQAQRDVPSAQGAARRGMPPRHDLGFRRYCEPGWGRHPACRQAGCLPHCTAGRKPVSEVSVRWRVPPLQDFFGRRARAGGPCQAAAE